MGRGSSPEKLAQQLADTEEAIVTLRSPFRVEQYVSKRWGVTPRQVRRWIRAVRQKWRENATLEGRELKRDDMRETLAAILRAALTRTEHVKDDEGKTVYAMIENKETGERKQKLTEAGFPIPMTRTKPDLQRALHACAQLRHLDALDEPFRAKLIIDAELDAMPDLKALTAEGYEKLRELLQSVSPDKDLRKLAGDLFEKPTSSSDALSN